jgi:hypothetical protein
MAKLMDIARVVRGKNAGALQLTLDVMFEDEETYRRVRDSGALSPRVIAPLYGVTDNEVAVIPFDVARAIKITVPRRVRSGSPGDTDVYGAQQHVPLMRIDVPD